MDQSLHIFSENLLHMFRGALMMLFVVICVGLYPQRKRGSIPNYLFWLVVAMGAFLAVSFALMFDQVRDNKVMLNFITLLDLCLVPMIASFLMKVVVPEYVNGRRTLLVLIPTIVLMVSYTFTHNKLLLTLSFGYSGLVALAGFVMVIVLSLRYDHILKENFSNIDDKNLGWVRATIYIFAAWYLAWVAIKTADNRWLDSAYYIFLITIWVYIYRHTVRHVAVVSAQKLFEPEQSAEPVEADKPAEESDIQPNVNLATDLEHYMAKVRPWQDKSLTLNDLADQLNTNRTYLSQHFNNTLGTTFYDYLNGFRVEYACNILLSEPNLSLAEVGERSGFNSLSTFRRAFEKSVGCTPAGFRIRK